MQHHGAPTRLLDFTWSPYVAAFFALVQTTKQAAVWAVNPKRLVNVTERFNEFLGNCRVGPIGIGEPFVMNMRLIAQSGTFIVTKQVGTPIEDIVVAYKDPKDTLVKFELSAELVRPPGMRALFMMNITNATLFPDLDGLARSLAYKLEFTGHTTLERFCRTPTNGRMPFQVTLCIPSVNTKSNRANIIAASIYFPMCRHSATCGMANQRRSATQSTTRCTTAGRMMQ